ncbi:MAG: hypothetical protein NWE95_08420 [Candidatus Bathyarchaeota archaeon]|nr:hypothetical protein [Candidatus Bathyarchaeota archaeon]
MQEICLLSSAGYHDDVFWATTLAVYATMEMAPEPFLAVVPDDEPLAFKYIWEAKDSNLTIRKRLIEF